MPGTKNIWITITITDTPITTPIDIWLIKWLLKATGTGRCRYIKNFKYHNRNLEKHTNSLKYRLSKKMTLSGIFTAKYKPMIVKFLMVI